MRKVLFLRKKTEGENSMEELAYNLVKEIQDVELHVLPEYSTTLKGMWKNVKYARKYQGEVNHIFSISDAYLCIFLKGKKIITCHDLGSLNSFRWYGRFVAWVVWVYIASLFWSECTCISSVVANELKHKLPWKTKHIQVIYNFYNKNIHFTPKVPNTQCPIILHVGTGLRKNLTNVIYALKGINCKLWIVGKMFKEQEAALQNCKTNYENEFDIPFSKMIELYKIADIISFPSSYEGFGVPLIEANAAGRPVIAGDIPILHEVGQDAALFVNPHNILELKNTFLSLIENPNLYNELVNKGKLNAERFKIAEIANQYSKLYEI